MNKEVIAENLFRTLQVGIRIGVDDNYLNTIYDDDSLDENIRALAKNIEIKLINNGYTDFKETLLLIVNLCTPANSTKKRKMLAQAYSWLGAKYRKKAIITINEYINKDLQLENRIPYPLFQNGKRLITINLDAQNCISQLWNLSKAYEGEYMFDLALQTLKKANELFPYDYTTITKMCNIYRKTNDLDNAINLLKTSLREDWAQPYTYYYELKHTDWYDDCNQRCLLVDLDKYTKLKESGYIYKPRKKDA